MRLKYTRAPTNIAGNDDVLNSENLTTPPEGSGGGASAAVLALPLTEAAGAGAEGLAPPPAGSKGGAVAAVLALPLTEAAGAGAEVLARATRSDDAAALAWATADTPGAVATPSLLESTSVFAFETLL